MLVGSRDCQYERDVQRVGPHRSSKANCSPNNTDAGRGPLFEPIEARGLNLLAVQFVSEGLGVRAPVVADCVHHSEEAVSVTTRFTRSITPGRPRPIGCNKDTPLTYSSVFASA